MTTELSDIREELQAIRAALEPLVDRGKPFLTYEEAGKVANCKRDTITRLVAAGHLTRQGFSSRRVLIRRDELLELISKGESITGIN